MNTIISQNAKLVFVSTVISQNGRLDTVMVIGTNIRMVRELVESLGFRPALPQLAKMYTSIAAAALIAGGLEDLELEQVFPNLGMGVLGAIPGFQLIAASLLQGMANAFLTLRVGVMTKNTVCQVRLRIRAPFEAESLVFSTNEMSSTGAAVPCTHKLEPFL